MSPGSPPVKQPHRHWSQVSSISTTIGSIHPVEISPNWPPSRSRTCDLRPRRAEKSIKTILDNGLSSPDLGVRQNTRCHGIRWGQILSTRCLQEVIEKTDLKYLLTKLFTRHFMDISFYCFLVSLIFISLTNRYHNHCYSLIYYFIDKTIATRS
ncbi:MAG: hypothetical protein RLZZ620_1301 [Pseudomonadota bacterium]